MFPFRFGIVFFISLYVTTAGWNLKMKNFPYILFKEEWKAEDPVVPPLRTQITDTTSTLTNAQKSSLTDTLIAFEKRKGSQIAVLIVGSTGSRTIKEYAVKVFETWKLGRKGIDDGILIVVAIQDHKTRIEVGYGLEGAIPDAIAKRIIEEFMIPRFRDGDYFQGVSDGIDKLITKIDGEELPKTGASAPPSDINVDSPITEEEFRTIEQKDDFDKDIVFLPVLIPVAIFAVAILITSGIVGLVILTGVGFFFHFLSTSIILTICFAILFIAFILIMGEIKKNIARKSFWRIFLFGYGSKSSSGSVWSSSSSSSGGGSSWSGGGGSSGGGGASGSW
ncbi:TPM domain-containing protein [Leptospira alexanderi]|uniref:PF04536 family protein n=1 Tax=Leptospira alexanderi serovar Manhao 3 str. L 60 TaxID=1049759 RepID=V6HXN4_9LEPT|nr:TPM domain-containing protein [Leptospira alexanderi]EQA62271.1 PF04536 family protein [Leptospira alexanderi serovar Manhao 3 str. L 60]